MKVGEAFTRAAAIFIADKHRRNGVTIDIKYSHALKKWLVYKYVNPSMKMHNEMHNEWKNQMREELG